MSATHTIKRFNDSKYLLLLFFPFFIYMIIFNYIPMWGVLIAFKNYSIYKGFFASPWVGLENIVRFLKGPMVFMVTKNTFLLSLYSILWGFPQPILFALLLNEVQNVKFKKFIQTVSYMPHFLSVVTVVGMFTMFLSARGLVNMIISNLGMHPVMFMSKPSYFRSIYIIMDSWQGTGWAAIIYLAALANVDPNIYEAALIDGANKFQRIVFITIPSILPTIITLFILNTGSLLSIGFEKIFLMQNAANISVSEVLTTYVYRQGLVMGDMGYATAIGVCNSLVSLIFVISNNYLTRKYSEYSIW